VKEREEGELDILGYLSWRKKGLLILEMSVSRQTVNENEAMVIG
jgi:hypothetical protein